MNEKSLHAVIQRASLTSARALMDEIDRAIHMRINQWRSYSRTQAVLAPLRRSNSRFEQMADVDEHLVEHDQQWRNAPSQQVPAMINHVRDESLSRDLRQMLEVLRKANGHDVFAEAFVTNRYGAVAAMTNRTSDYRQDDELWWQQAMRHGVHVGDIGFDESAGVYSTAICIRVDDHAGQPMGVLKAVLNIQQIIELVRHREARLMDDGASSVVLTTSAGQVINADLRQSPLPGDSSQSFESTDEQMLRVSAESQGFSDFPGLGWRLWLSYPAKSVYAPVWALRRRMLVIAGVTTAAAMLIGTVLSLSISRRAKRLMYAAAVIGEGRLDEPVKPEGRDELGQLALSLERMRVRLLSSHEVLAMRLAAIECTQDMVMVCDADGIIEYVNPSFCRCTGYTADEAVGQSTNLLKSGEHDDAFYDRLWKTVRGGEVWRGEMINRRKDASLYPEQMTITPVRDEAGTIVRFVAIKRDVTEQKRAREAEAAREHLQNAVVSMERVLGVVGHELRTPIAALRATTEFLLTPEAKQLDEWDAFISNVHNEIVHMAELVNNLLEAARLNSGCAKWNWSHVNIPEACDEALNVIRPLMPHDNVELGIRVEPHDLSMNGDPEAVRRLLINFISNSVKHTREGFVRIDAREARDSTGRWIDVTITDTGDGIPEKIFHKLGQAFVLNAGLVGSDYVKGAGLGLSICRGIVAAHGGSIAVRSKVGQGATFTIRLRADLTEPAQINQDNTIELEAAA